MKPGLNRVGLVLRNYCTLHWNVSIRWKCNSNMSGICTANSKANFSSSSGSTRLLAGWLALSLNHSIADKSCPRKSMKTNSRLAWIVME